LPPSDVSRYGRDQHARAPAAVFPTLPASLSSRQPRIGLWRRTLPSARRTGFGSALYFTSLNALRQGVANRSPDVFAKVRTPTENPTSALPKLSHTANLVTGAIARVMAGFAMMPVTVLKVR